MGCEGRSSHWSPNRRSCRTHRVGPGRPSLQGFGTVAALERDDRSVISERVPRCLPDNGGNEVRRAVQAAGGILHTSRTGSGARVGSLPWRMSAASHVPPISRAPHTCSRGAGTGGASVGVQGEGSPFTRYRERWRERCTRYRGVSLAGAMDRRRDGERWRGRSRGQSCEARCRTRRRSRLHGSRQSCRHDGGRAVRMPVRGEAGAGDASGAMAASRCDGRGEHGAKRRREHRPTRGGQ